MSAHVSSRQAENGAPGENRRLERDHRALGLGVAAHAGMKPWLSMIPGRGRQQRSLDDECGLERAGLLGAQPDEIGNAVIRYEIRRRLCPACFRKGDGVMVSPSGTRGAGSTKVRAGRR